MLGGSITRGGGAKRAHYSYAFRFLNAINASFPHRWPCSVAVLCTRMSSSAALKLALHVFPARAHNAPMGTNTPATRTPMCSGHVFENKGINAATSLLYAPCMSYHVPEGADLVVLEVRNRGQTAMHVCP